MSGGNQREDGYTKRIEALQALKLALEDDARFQSAEIELDTDSFCLVVYLGDVTYTVDVAAPNVSSRVAFSPKAVALLDDAREDVQGGEG